MDIVFSHSSKIVVSCDRSISRIRCVLAAMHPISIISIREATHHIHVWNSMAIIILELLLIASWQLILFIAHQFLI